MICFLVFARLSVFVNLSLTCILHQTAPDALAQVKRSFKGLFKRNKQKTSGTSTQQPAPSSTVQELSAGGVAAPVHAGKIQ